jgi:hypothetical protein
MKYLNLTLEFIWFAAAIGCALGAIKQFAAHDNRIGIIFCIMSLVSIFMFYSRRARRITNKNKQP